MNRVAQRSLIVIAALLFGLFAFKAHGQDISPAQHVNVWGVTTPGEYPPLFGPVLTITDGGGFEHMQIDATGSIVFRHAATIQFADTTVHAGHIRGFVYIRMVDGSQALMPVFALPGDTTDYGVTIDP